MLHQAATLLGQHFETLLLLYWSLASFASTVALLPVPGAAGFRCGAQHQQCPHAHKPMAACATRLASIMPQSMHQGATTQLQQTYAG